MPGEILLVNPRHRSRKRKGRARRRGKRRLTALQRAFGFGGRRSRRAHRRGGRKHHHRKRHRARRRSSPATAPVTVLTSNPRRRSRSRAALAGIGGALVPAAIGAAGAVGVDFVMGMLPQSIVGQYQGTMWGLLLKGGAALLMGAAASSLINSRTGMLVTTGALTVVAYDAYQTFVGQAGTTAQYGGLRVGRYVRMSGVPLTRPWRVPGLGRMKGAPLTRPWRVPGLGKLGYISPARPLGRVAPVMKRQPGTAPRAMRNQLMSGVRVGRYVPF